MKKFKRFSLFNEFKRLGFYLNLALLILSDKTFAPLRALRETKILRGFISKKRGCQSTASDLLTQNYLLNNNFFVDDGFVVGI